MADQSINVLTLKLDGAFTLVALAYRGETAIEFQVSDQNGKVQRVSSQDALALAAMAQATRA